MADDKPKRRGRTGPRPPQMAMGAITKRLRGSGIIYDQRDTLALELLGLASAKLTDIVSWDEDGKARIRAFKDVPEHVKAAIKKVKITPTQHGDIMEFEIVESDGEVEAAPPQPTMNVITVEDEVNSE